MKKYIKFSVILLSFLILFFILKRPLPFKDNSYSTVILDKNDNILRIFLNNKEQFHLPPKDENINYKLEKAIINFEDKYFYYHIGFNPFSIIRSFYINLKNNKVLGASTITMQVSRLNNPQKRTYINKILEILYSIKLEIWFTKKKILKMYLNNAPFGSNIVGYQSAIYYYFQKKESDITWAQACTLAVLPNSPSLISPFVNKEILIKKRNYLLNKLYKNKIINDEEYKLSILEDIPKINYSNKINIPHLSQFLKKKYNDKSIIKTFIDKNIQNNIEKIADNYSKQLQIYGIKNLSIIIADTKSANVISYIGSQNFFSKETNGMVDGVLAYRSTASTLKPFLYTLAFERGYILPETLLRDVPLNFNSFSPENFDKSFSGFVKAKDSLIKSLNIPSVDLLNIYGVKDFYYFLKKANFNGLFRKYDDYGLTLILGGAEANLYEITSLYNSLGNLGIYKGLKLCEYDNYQDFRLLNRGASFLTLDILKELNRPNTEFFWKNYSNSKSIAWKTGTSFGNKDAWAIGVSPDWTIGVWTGNFTGESNLKLLGATSSGNLMFEIFNYLSNIKNTKSWFEKPINDFNFIKICKDTGFKSGEYCNNKELTYIVNNTSHLKICPYHKKYFVSKTGKNIVCSLCRDSEYKEINVLEFPLEINFYLKNKNILPPHNPQCPSIKNDLEIIYPKEDMRIFIPRDFNNNQKVNLKVSSQNNNTKIFWYLNNELINTTKNIHTTSIYLKKGVYKLSVVDDNGNKKIRNFYID